MDLDDVSDASFGDRKAHYLKGWLREGASMEEKITVDQMTDRMVTAEMLDEIHTMLRELLKRSLEDD